VGEEREWTIVIETPKETTRDDDAFRRADEAMRAQAGAIGPALLLAHSSGVISARFQVRAATLDEAHALGVRVFADAMREAGFSGERAWRVVEAEEFEGEQAD
jgi:hypothetical protein